MRFRLFVIIAAAVLLLPRAILGQQAQRPLPDISHGNGLLLSCTWDSKSDADAAFGNLMYCMGYIHGVTDSLAVGGLVEIPQGVTVGQINAVAIKYLKDHPELLHQTSIELITDALTNVWGRQKKKP